MRLSYSNYRTYLNCPRLYYNQVNKVPTDVLDDAYNALYGRLIERFFRKHANVYSKRAVELTENEIRTVMTGEWTHILKRSYVNWSEPWVKLGSDEIFETVMEDIRKNLEAFDFWKQCQSEVSFLIELKKSRDVLSCRMDFIRESDQGIEILDGKGTMKMDKNVDIEQLYFYALMYLLKYRKLPDRIGFLYYRYQLVKYVDYDAEILSKFKDKLNIVKRVIKADKIFTPKPMLSKHCRYCLWRYKCDAFAAKKLIYASKKKNKVGVEPAGQVVNLGV